MVGVVVTRDTISKMVSLLDWCYQIGVESAHELNDEGLCWNFIDETAQAGVYGFLEENPQYIGWQEWALRLSAKARSESYSGSMKKFFDKMGRFGSNYLSAFLPLTQVFHTKGIKDYMEAPSAANVEVFRKKTRHWWTKNGLRFVSNDVWVSELQMESFDLERRDKLVYDSMNEYQAKKIALTPKQYEQFRRCVGLLMNRNVTY